MASHAAVGIDDDLAAGKTGIAHRTAKEGLSDANIQAAVNQVFDLRPAAIIRELDLLRPIYAQTAAYGHFGRTDVELPWEQLNRVEALRAAAGL